MAALVVGVVAVAPACTSSDPGPEQPPPRPNIVVIMTDDQPPTGTLEVMPETSEWFETQGRTYTNAFATTPLCCPSRASVMTGLQAHHHGVHVDMNQDAERLDQSATVQRHLRAAGYRTGYFGKYLNGWPLKVDPPHFDRWGIFDNSNPKGYYGATWNVQGRRRVIEEYSTDYIARRGVGFISEARSGEPFLLFLAPAAPHHPYEAEPDFADAPVGRARIDWERDTSDKPGFWRDRAVTKPAARKLRAHQLRTLMSVDELVADVRAQLQRSDVTDQTLVVFMSDNGYLWGQHRLTGKMAPYTPSAGIPLMATWPGRISTGVDDRIVANVDVAATIFDAARIDDPPANDGISLLDDRTRDHLLLRFWAAYARPGWASLRTPEFQYIEYYRSGSDGPVIAREYYDLVADPGQDLNLLGDDDPANDPDVEDLSRRLQATKTCEVGACDR